MSKIIKLKEEDLIPESESQEQVYPATITRAATTTYEDYPGTEVVGEETINLEEDLKNLWAALGDTAIKPATTVNTQYDGNTHLLTVPDNCRYTLTLDEGQPIPMDVDTYTYTASVKPGYVWRDGTVGDVTVTQTIYQAKRNLNPNTLVFAYSSYIVYNGVAQPITKIYKPSDYTGKIYYSNNGGISWLEYTSSIMWKDAGTANLLIKAEETTLYNGLQYPLTIVIHPMPIAYPKIKADYTYTGSEINATFLDGTAITYDGTTQIEVLSDSVIKATEHKAITNYPIYFKPRTNYVWETTEGSESYELDWNITVKTMTATWNIEYAYSVNSVLPNEIATLTGAELAYFLCDASGNKLKQIYGGYKFVKEDVGTKRIKIEYAKDYPTYSAITNDITEPITINYASNVVTWGDVPSSIMLGSTYTLIASATYGKIVFRKDSITGEVVGGQPVLVEGKYQTTWTPALGGAYTIYACNVDWDEKLYTQAEAVAKVLTVESQCQSVITWSGDTETHHPGDTLTLPSDAITNTKYGDYKGIVKYYLGDFSEYPDGTPPSVSPITSPYTIKASDVEGLTITAFNVNNVSQYASVAAKVMRSFNVQKSESTMVLTKSSDTAYIDTPWTLTVDYTSGDIDFRIKTNEGWSSLKGDSRATITPITDTQVKLSYKFVGPAGTTASIQVHNTPATGYEEPTNQDAVVTVGIYAMTNVITRTLPTTQEVSVKKGETVNLSAFATSGYVQYWNGNPDDLINPGTLITEGYNQGATGEACTLSNYTITKDTTYIYMRNVGYDGSYSQAPDTYVKVNALSSTALYLEMVGGATGTGKVGTALTYSATIKDSLGTDFTSEFEIKYYINGVEYASGTYTPTETGTVTVIAKVTDVSAKAGYTVTEQTKTKAFTIKEAVAWRGYNLTEEQIPTTEAEILACEETEGFTNWNLMDIEPHAVWVAVKGTHTASITNSIGAPALIQRSSAVEGYTLYYEVESLGYSAILNCEIN